MPSRLHAWRWPAAFVLLWIGAGLRAIAMGKDANWDLRNYHFYNAWALLNGRLGFDYAPAQLQTFHNPLVELPFYGLVHLIDNPRTVAFFMAIFVAAGGFFLLRLLVLLFPFDRDRANGLLWTTCAFAIGMLGAAGAAAWATSTNEWPSVALVMAALWLVVRAMAQGPGEDALPTVALAALLVGCATGLKLTYGVFAIGFGVACLTWGRWPQRVRRAAWAGAFMAVGFAMTHGWWSLVLWREFENPFFPYFNGWFRSPWWEAASFYDPNYGPRTWKQWVFFPLYFARQSLLVGEIAFRDYRLATLLVAALVALAVARARRLAGRAPPAAFTPSTRGAPWWFLGVFALVSYLAWLNVFGIYRYVVVLELLSGPLIVGCVLAAFRPGRARIATLVVLTVLIVGTTRPGGWGRVPYGKKYFEVRAPKLPEGSLVIMGWSHPLGYAAPFLGTGARYVSPASNLTRPGKSHRMATRMEEVIRSHLGPVYLLEYRTRHHEDVATVGYFGLDFDPRPCQPVDSTLDENAMQLCRLVPKH